MTLEPTQEQVNEDTRLRTLDELLAESRSERKQRHSRIIRDLERVVYNSEWFQEKPQRIQDLYRAYPPWGFYTFKPDAAGQQCRLPIRHYGVVEYADGSLGFRACSARPGFTNDIVGGIPEGRLEKIEWWDDNQIDVIKENNVPRAFFEPMGFMIFTND